MKKQNYHATFTKNDGSRMTRARHVNGPIDFFPSVSYTASSIDTSRETYSGMHVFVINLLFQRKRKQINLKIVKCKCNLVSGKNSKRSTNSS